MTLEEAKKEINRLADCLWSDFDKNPNKMTYGEAIAYEEVCHILDEIDTEPIGNPDKMNLDNVIRNLESDEAVCRSHGEDDYFKGMADGYKLSIDALQGLSRKPEQLTLKELAREMRKLFEFDYVTVDANESITFWVRKPLYISMCGLWERNAYLDSWDIFNIDFSSAVNLDLSEYKDADGNIDYSKCIVEVSDEA